MTGGGSGYCRSMPVRTTGPRAAAAAPDPTPAAGPRIVTVPARHPYVATVRPDPARPVAVDRVHGWEPDPYLDAASVPGWAADADLVHLHFGFDHLDRAAVDRWADALAAAGIPLVFTAHDLRNPHHTDPAAHTDVLAALLDRAAAVLTLTPGAATEIADRWGRSAQVLPHPTLVDPARTADVATEPGLVVVHLKSLRRNLIDPVALVAAAAAGASAGGGRLRVDVHPDVVDDPRLAGLRPGPGLEVAVHPRYDDLDLERYLRRAHVTVLPHRWGTHSGWLELARDLGTAVVAPSCGHYRDQWDRVHTYTNDEHFGFDPASLTAAVARAVTEPPPAPADRAERLAQAAAVRVGHGQLYDRLVGAGR